MTYKEALNLAAKARGYDNFAHASISTKEIIVMHDAAEIYAKQAAIDALSKAERMEEIEQKDVLAKSIEDYCNELGEKYLPEPKEQPNPFAVQSLDRYDSGELGELLDVVRMAINGKVPTKYESLDFWSYRLRDAMDIKRKQ